MARSIESNTHQRPAIDADLARELSKYIGRWVAVDEGKNVVVGSGSSAAEAAEAAQRANVTDPLILRVPTHTRRVRIR